MDQPGAYERLEDVSVRELRDICHDVTASIGKEEKNGRVPEE